jgi:YihY family inner membrane protein
VSLIERLPDFLQRPIEFALQVLKSFRANQGLLLAGAIAYYTLLSMVPLLILAIMALSHFTDPAAVLATVRRALEWVAPGQSQGLTQELVSFLTGRLSIGWILLVTLLVFSSLAFTVLENAFSVIFHHRLAERKRHVLVSLLIPFGYMVFIGVGLLLGTVLTASLDAVGKESLVVFVEVWSLVGFSGYALYGIGVAVEILLVSSIYLVMPVGRIPVRHALIGGTVAALLWEGVRHLLVWYFRNISQVSLVYGSLTSAIVVLLSFEIAATLLLVGAQVIAEYERRKT